MSHANLPVISNFSNIILKALVSRQNAIDASSASIEAKNSQSNQLAPLFDRMTDNLMKQARKIMVHTDFELVAKAIKTCDASGKGIEQVKTIVKIVDVIAHVSQGVSASDNNFNTCISAILKNGNSANISELIVAQSGKARESCAHKCRESFTVRSATYTIGTGTSQSSQVRQVLRVLGFATAQKGKKDDTLTMLDYGVNLLAPFYSELKAK